MRKMRFVGIPFVLCGIAAVAVAGLVTTGLWNLLMPEIFGLRAITFWQGLGLLILSRLFFGRFGGGRFGGRQRGRRFVRGWKDLTPEERGRFSQAMGGCEPPPQRM